MRMGKGSVYLVPVLLRVQVQVHAQALLLILKVQAHPQVLLRVWLPLFFRLRFESASDQVAQLFAAAGSLHPPSAQPHLPPDADADSAWPVSYTHLTLPTIYSV